MNEHLKAIQSGNVTGSNVRGIKKAINATWRIENGYSVSSVAPKLAGTPELREIERSLREIEPLVRGDLHASGVRLLTSKRYKKRLEPVADVIATLHGFRLVRFDRIGRNGENCVPVYRAVGKSGSFLFRNVAWQAGGDGPELV